MELGLWQIPDLLIFTGSDWALTGDREASEQNIAEIRTFLNTDIGLIIYFMTILLVNDRFAVNEVGYPGMINSHKYRQLTV